MAWSGHQSVCPLSDLILTVVQLTDIDQALAHCAYLSNGFTPVHRHVCVYVCVCMCVVRVNLHACYRLDVLQRFVKANWSIVRPAAVFLYAVLPSRPNPGCVRVCLGLYVCCVSAWQNLALKSTNPGHPLITSTSLPAVLSIPVKFLTDGVNVLSRPVSHVLFWCFSITIVEETPELSQKK